ncbi:MAG: hypothetical protein V2I33_22340, partial [Kangiellaceae bacterium]|nr:hypothetical protein [Kangiellaceae bacterium]
MIWGNDVYTSDSDAVAIIQHTGFIDLPKNPALLEYEGVSLYVRVTKGRTNYVSSLKCRIRSKKATNYEGHSLRPERLNFLSSLGKIEELIEMASRMPSEYVRQRIKPTLNMRETKIIPTTLMVFNLSFEPTSIYSLDLLAEKGLEENQFVSYKLRTSSLYLESSNDRFELSLCQDTGETPAAAATGEDDLFEEKERFRWGVVKQPILFKDQKFMEDVKVPLAEEHVSV